MARGRTVVGPRYVVRTLEVCLFLALACSCCAAFDGDRTIAQFAHTAWGSKDGAPSVVTALAQSADGYLWLGSTDGLYRFDGVVFEQYQPQSGSPFPARTVRSLLALSNGDLWIGFRSGAISLLRNGHATNYTARDGVPGGMVRSFAQDPQGTIWAASESGLARLEGNRWKEVGKDWNFQGKAAGAIFLDREGTLWVATEETLVFLSSGARRFQSTGIKVGQVAQIGQAASGKLWMAETSRSVRPIPLSDKGQPPDATEVQVGSIGILFDNDGALWITSLGDGLRRSPAPELLKGRIKEFGTAVESFTAKDGLSDDYERAIFQDREGNIWVGTNNGLDRFRKTKLVPVVLPFDFRQAIWVAGDAGDAWAYRNFMFRVHGGRVDRGGPLPSDAISAYRDPAGAIWWLCEDAIYRYHAGNYTRLPLPPSFPKPYSASAMVATEDASGALWLSAEREGLFYRKQGEWQRLETASEFAKLPPRTAFTDWMGRAWFGYEGGTIIIVEHENLQKVFPAEDSPVGNLRAINGRGRHTWVGGESGLALFDGSRFQRIVPVDTEAFGSVLGVEETPDGSLWLAEGRGVIQVSASEVRQVLDNPSYRVRYRIFDSFDGLPGTILGAGEIQGTDGRLWFGASGGVVWIDPANVFTNALPPAVLIRSLKTNGRQFDSLANLVLPPRTTDLQIGYTALSLSVPEKVHFRYRLEGVDNDWQDAGTRREAIYTRLGPGEYHFRVIACNNDGVWNEEGAHLDFNIAPAWFQTTWFRILCFVVATLMIWGVYRLRVRQIARAMTARFDERLAERTLMAQELHDTILQTIQGTKFVADDALKNVNDPIRTRRALQQVSEWLAQAIQEARATLHSLRISIAETDDLAAAFRRALEDCRRESSMEAVFSVTGDARDLHPVVRDEIYRIGYEAIRNACTHSTGSRVDVALSYGENLSVRVRDNGAGINPDIAETGKNGHFGLQGMRERADRIGARLTIVSAADSGTEVKVVVPGRIVFRKPRSTPFDKIKTALKRDSNS